MTRRVLWSSAALDDFDGAIAFIAARGPAGARQVASAINRAARGLRDVPTGRPGRVGGTYEKVVRGAPYLLADALSPDDRAVVILRVIHSARDWPDESWPD